MPIHIPPELWIKIIQDVGEPSHPRAYSIPPQAKATLLSLCLVNQTFNIWAKPFLYKRVSLSEVQITPFLHTLIDHRIQGSCEYLVEYFSVRDTSFNGHITKSIVDILEKLDTSKLKCLYFQYAAGVWLWHMREILPRRLPELPNLVERCSWVSWEPSTRELERTVYFVDPSHMLPIEADLAKIESGVEVTLVIQLDLIALHISQRLSFVHIRGQLARIGSLTIIFWGMGENDQSEGTIAILQGFVAALDAIADAALPRCFLIRGVSESSDPAARGSWLDKGILEGGFWDIKTVEYGEKWRNEMVKVWSLKASV